METTIDLKKEIKIARQLSDRLISRLVRIGRLAGTLATDKTQRLNVKQYEREVYRARHDFEMKLINNSYPLTTLAKANLPTAGTTANSTSLATSNESIEPVDLKAEIEQAYEEWNELKYQVTKVTYDALDLAETEHEQIYITPFNQAISDALNEFAKILIPNLNQLKETCVDHNISR